MRNTNVEYGEIPFQEDSSVQVQQQSQVKISNLFAILEKVGAHVDIRVARRSVSDKIETSVQMNIDFCGKPFL